jgi:hypothetical protein
MADLHKHDDHEDWLTWAIEFLGRGLWLDEYITVHGPHDASGTMWGEAIARLDGEQWGPDCSFRAIAQRSKYRPVRIRIWNSDNKEERFPRLKTSELTPKAQRWLRVARRTLKKLRDDYLTGTNLVF